MLTDIITAIVAFIPAMAANSLAVIFGGKYPIDGGGKIGGKRILGDGKTWSGLLGGVISATVLGILLSFVSESLYPSGVEGYIIIFSLSLGALLGDICSSFIKRRLGRSRGERTPLVDEYDFVAGALLLTIIVSPTWIMKTYIVDNNWIPLLMILILIPVLHRTTNIIGYRLGMKKEPW